MPPVPPPLGYGPALLHKKHGTAIMQIMHTFSVALVEDVGDKTEGVLLQRFSFVFLKIDLNNVITSKVTSLQIV